MEEEKVDRSNYESFRRLPDVAVDELGRDERFKCDGPEKLEDVDDVWRRKAPELYVDCPPRVSREEAEAKEAKKYAMRLEAERVDDLFRSLAANPIAVNPVAVYSLTPALALTPTHASSVNATGEYCDDGDGEGRDDNEHGWSSLSVIPPTPTPTPAPSATFADSSVIPGFGEYQAEDDDAEGEYESDMSHLFASESLAPAPGTARALAPTPTPSQTAPVPASSVVAVGEQYQDEDKDGRDDTGPLAFPAPLSAPAPTASVPAPNVGVPAPAPATAGSYPTLAPVSALTVSGPAAVAGFPAFPPPATSAPAPAPAPAFAAAAVPAAAVPGPATAGYPAILPPPNFPPIPAGFHLHRARGRYFLTGPDWTGGVPNPPAMNFLGLRKLDGAANENSACRFCKCSKWLWFPTFFQRVEDPQGLKHMCNRCACRGRTSNRKEVGDQEWARQRNQWLVVNRPIMFCLIRTGV